MSTPVTSWTTIAPEGDQDEADEDERDDHECRVAAVDDGEEDSEDDRDAERETTPPPEAVGGRHAVATRAAVVT